MDERGARGPETSDVVGCRRYGCPIGRVIGDGKAGPGVAHAGEVSVQTPHGDALGVPARQALGFRLHMGKHVRQHGIQNQDELPDEPVPGVLVMGLAGGHGGKAAPGLLEPGI